MIVNIIGWFLLVFIVLHFFAMWINIYTTGKTATPNAGIEWCLMVIAAAICFK